MEAVRLVGFERADKHESKCLSGGQYTTMCGCARRPFLLSARTNKLLLFIANLTNKTTVQVIAYLHVNLSIRLGEYFK